MRQASISATLCTLHLTVTKPFGGYISRYDFKRSEEDGSTVKLVYENRGEKLGLARLDLNDTIAAKIEEAAAKISRKIVAGQQ